MTQGNAQNALAVLNNAITYVAAQDGYIGAQINTLNSVSQVMSTQKENVVSAQNAIQATDYASATSNMSKYEILSQTGIAALAQANSVQQEVTNRFCSRFFADHALLIGFASKPRDKGRRQRFNSAASFSSLHQDRFNGMPNREFASNPASSLVSRYSSNHTFDCFQGCQVGSNQSECHPDSVGLTHRGEHA